MFTKECQLFRTTAVQKWVTLLQAQDMLALLQRFESEAKQLFLCRISITWKLASNLDRCPAWNEIQDASRHELVGKDEVCRLNCVESCSGEEIRMAWARTCKSDSAPTHKTSI